MALPDKLYEQIRGLAPDRARALRPGTHVRSRAIGCVPAFVGVIVEAFGRGRKRYYHVRRLRDGVIWHRDAVELKPVTRKSKRKEIADAGSAKLPSVPRERPDVV